MQHEAQPQESQQYQLVEKQVRYHGKAPYTVVKWEHFTRFSGYRNYPQDRGTRPDQFTGYRLDQRVVQRGKN